MSGLLRRHWRQWGQPSLVRRLLISQMLVLLLLWTGLMAWVLQEVSHTEGLLAERSVYEAVISVAESLADQPQRQQQALRKLERAIRASAGDGLDDPGFSASVLVRQSGRPVYRPQGLDWLPPPARGDELIRFVSDASQWHARTVTSASGDTQVTFILPGTWDFAVSLVDRGYYLMPLLISLPVLILPAWLSVRVALRPWSRVSKEVAARGLQDLSPLSFQPSHKELRPLVRAVNSLLQRLRDGAARERSLIADAAHELRTPLAAMRVNVEALRNKSRDSALRELMGNLLRSNERASRLVSQLLQLMRSDAAKDSAPPSTISLDRLVEDRLAVLEGLAHARGVELELVCDAPMTIQGERESLISMIDNLVDNAIKYSPNRGVVTVRLGVASPDQVCLSVADEGPGIPAALRERVFDRFYRNPDQTQSGSGLGLAIVKSVVDLHAGSIALHAGSIALHGAAGGRGLRVDVLLPSPPAAAGSNHGYNAAGQERAF